MADTRRKVDLIIRAGDLVRVYGPRPVLRVGYPKCPEDFMPEVRLKHEAALRHIFGCMPEKESRPVERALRDLAHLACRRAGFGGHERTLHLGEPLAEMEGHVVRVLSVRTVKTGTYEPGHGGDWNSEGEPAGFVPGKTWRLARVPAPEVRPPKFLHVASRWGALEFQVGQLEKTVPCPTCAKKGYAGEPSPIKLGLCCCGTPFQPVGS